MQYLVWKIVGNQVVTGTRSGQTYRQPDEYRTASDAYTVLRDRLIVQQSQLQHQLNAVQAQLAGVEQNLVAALGAERREAIEHSGQSR